MAYGATCVTGGEPTVLISGASVAGPAAAYWLGRYGYRPTVVEVAPELRGGGFAVDFRGGVSLSVLERMGVLEEVRRRRTGGSPMSFIDERGEEVAALPPEFAGGEVEILRSDLSRILYEHSLHGRGADDNGPGGRDQGEGDRGEGDRGERGADDRDADNRDAVDHYLSATEYIFGDSITSLTETADGVHATFERGAPRTFDLVIGADGLHSTVRRLAFGPEEEFVSHLGYYIAGWDLPAVDADLGARPVGYNDPGRLVSVGRTTRRAGDPGYAGEVFAVFASDGLAYDRRDTEGQKKLITQAYEGSGWRVPELVRTVQDADGLYFDSISRVDVPRWSAGRIALLGDAAYGATVGGMGTGAAVVGAYVLAGELAAANGDHVTAFARYEERLRRVVTRCQEGGRRAGEFLAPPTKEAIDARNDLLNDPQALAEMLQEGADISEDIALDEYETGTRG
ncbi:FAD-dependent oxidoreductase [Streptomyces sp. CB02923]|uniref:FAD-dependent oxidoreductase n=1 Tax=Streptomyces sp. CB02923 TaxID=1718985 RepID=UPI00093D2B8A|nr:FAD-dependent oxidoreductase [Streptomyces sp. CB02923]OKI04600.1 FAD-dependent oxidoreductase [Streptomyces sp. CB02923]